MKEEKGKGRKGKKGEGGRKGRREGVTKEERKENNARVNILPKVDS